MEILTRWENFFHNSAVAYVGARVVLRMTRPYLRILGDDELLEYWSGIAKRLETQMQKQIWRSPTGTKQSKKKTFAWKLAVSKTRRHSGPKVKSQAKYEAWEHQVRSNPKKGKGKAGLQKVKQSFWVVKAQNVQF